MKQVFSFDDVLLVPKFSHIKSRKDVDTSTYVGGRYMEMPIISSNMDTVTGPKMTVAMEQAGGAGCLHRFWSIEDNIKAYKQSASNAWVSVGIGDYEYERAGELLDAGAATFVLDVANGGSIEVVKQTRWLKELLGTKADIIVGNFASKAVLETFMEKVGFNVAGYKVGIGGGSACTTRSVTGCGIPTFASLLDLRSISEHVDIIADGGIRNSGDLAKALAVGARGVMCGKLLVGATESASPFEQYDDHQTHMFLAVGKEPPKYKKYRGSASQESYVAQGKEAPWRAPEGESFLVPYAGAVQTIMQGLEGGLRSSMSYMNAATLAEFRYNADFVTVTGAGIRENGAHGT